LPTFDVDFEYAEEGHVIELALCKDVVDLLTALCDPARCVGNRRIGDRQENCEERYVGHEQAGERSLNGSCGVVLQDNATERTERAFAWGAFFAVENSKTDRTRCLIGGVPAEVSNSALAMVELVRLD
jgi:hypothetical protein